MAKAVRARLDLQRYTRQTLRAELFFEEYVRARENETIETKVYAFYGRKKWGKTDFKKVSNK